MYFVQPVSSRPGNSRDGEIRKPNSPMLIASIFGFLFLLFIAFLFLCPLPSSEKSEKSEGDCRCGPHYNCHTAKAPTGPSIYINNGINVGKSGKQLGRTDPNTVFLDESDLQRMTETRKAEKEKRLLKQSPSLQGTWNHNEPVWLTPELCARCALRAGKSDVAPNP